MNQSNLMVSSEDLKQTIRRMLRGLPQRDRLILHLYFGFEGGRRHSFTQIASAIGVSRTTVGRRLAQSLRALRHSSMTDNEAAALDENEYRPPAEISFVVEAIRALTPELIFHLRNHFDDIDKIPWNVFEHLVGEFFAQRGFSDVRLVGRDSRTSADLYAAKMDPAVGMTLRFYIEVKRLQEPIGIQVVNSVLGALLTERESVGWHAGLIVTTGGFRAFKKYTPLQLSLKGIELKGRNDLLRWLDDYKPDKKGLWLPSPKKILPISNKV